MSSTNRGAVRTPHDYYITKVPEIERFLHAWMRDDPEVAAMLRARSTRILDPCAGGNTKAVRWTFKKGKSGKPDTVINVPPTPMSYPTAIRRVFGDSPIVNTVELRENSPAELQGDFLAMDSFPWSPHVSITNPPFGLAMEVINHSLGITRLGGYVAMLLRLNFFGSKKRKRFFDVNPPQRAYVHHERMGFIVGEVLSGDIGSGTDSIEYAHMVWKVGHRVDHTMLKVI